MTKKEFAEALQALEPKLKTTGMTPSIQTIYGYLNGKRELKVELIPYMAEVLGVQEQELFEFDIEYASLYSYKYSKDIREIVKLLTYASKPILEDIRNLLLDLKQTSQNRLDTIREQHK